MNCIGCEFLLESISQDFLVLCKTGIKSLLVFSNFYVRSSLVRNDCVSRNHALHHFHFASHSSHDNSNDYLFMFMFWLYFLQCLIFRLCQSPSSSFAQFFILLIKHRPELFLQSVYQCIVFEDFNVYHKDWLSCSGEVYRQDEFCYNFVSLRTSLRLLTSLHGLLTIMSTFVLFWT